MTVFVDSNIFIFANIEEYPEHEIAVKTIESLIKKEKILINSIIVSEIFHKLFRLTNLSEARSRTLKILNSEHVIFIPIEKETIIRAINLSWRYKIRINDAIIAQHTIDSKAKRILTDNVKDFRKIQGLNIIPFKRCNWKG